MISKLAGNLPLADMVARIIDDSRVKIAAAEGKDDDKVKKLVDYEKKEHGHVPSVKEEKEEKGKDKEASAVIDFSDPEEVEKLASALETVGDQLMKTAADGQDHGAEFKGGGETLAVMKPVSGKQPYKKDSSKAHNVPMSTEAQKGDGGAPAPTQMKNDHAKRPGGAPYPKKGVMKTAAESVIDKIRSAAAPKPTTMTEDVGHEDDSTEVEIKPDGSVAPKQEKPKSAAVARLQAALTGKNEEPKEEAKPAEVVTFEKKDGEEKKAGAVEFILGKIANVEKKMGGETLDSKSGDGPKPPSGGTNSARSMIESNTAATNAKKVQAKAPQKKLMSEVLTEPMQSKAHDSKVSENLRNAAKGGVKIAAARELLKKVAEEGCTCDGKGECKHCKMKKAMEKKSMGMPMTGSPQPSTPAPSM